MKKILYTLFFLSGCFYSTAQIDYQDGIKPILQTHCISCHAKTGIGTMPLSSYKEVRAYGKMIEYVTANRLMPPLKADADFSRSKNHIKLTDIELAAIKTWVENGMPEGKASDGTVMSAVKTGTGIHKPDMVVAMAEPFTIADDYTERSQVFVIPVQLKNTEFIDSIEFVPGNTRLIKSCTVSIDTGQTSMRYDGNDMDYGYKSSTGVGFIPYQYLWYQWMPGEPTAFYPSPYLKSLPANSRMLLHITYVATKSIQQDSSYLKLHFARKIEKPKAIRSEILLDTTNITNGPFKLGVGDKKRFYAVRQIKQPVEIHSIMPMGQTALSSWEIYAVDSATGKRSNLLKIPYWDAHWKKKYVLETPVRLSSGSKIFGVAYYNNSDGNDNLLVIPPKKIKYGEGQRDELFIVAFDVVYETKN